MITKPKQKQHHSNGYLGSCLCGEVQFKVTQFQSLAAHCHCAMCRKFHGAAFSSLVEVKQADFVWLSGRQFLTHYRAENDTIRSFCSQCGSSLCFSSRFNRQDNTIEVALACFDQAVPVKPDAHIFVDDKVAWYRINDGLCQFAGYRSQT